MKITRYKKVQKYLKFYYNNFGFHEPYQVLLDGTFCFAAFKFRRNGRLIDFVDDEWRAEQLPHEDILVPLEELPDPEADSADSHLTLKEQSMQTEKIAKKTHGALTILKQFGIHECGHKEPISGSNCIRSMIGKRNEKHYILASQDRDLQNILREKAGVPLLYLHNKSPTLEKPSKVSYDKAGQTLEADPHIFISETQNEALKSMKIALGVEDTAEKKKIHVRKKKPHNPNPLSCKKKKKKLGKNGQPALTGKGPQKGVNEGGVRKKKKKKLPKHLKESCLKASVGIS
ncbi:Uncharacterized protein OBRU01_20858 [Operophtera brumata]|uniref:UTP23 sensor motif region domain-containing protein n=1 Tax=Operophtera brumata TaxID=104452 RepID=A0A0L7KUM8_OPEBR|nr:Uncharacterized protein OBRU01_20858 [Operophtera brumata]